MIPVLVVKLVEGTLVESYEFVCEAEYQELLQGVERGEILEVIRLAD